MNIQSILNQYQIPCQNWGIGNTKTLTHLQKEVDERESSLVIEDNNLIRKVRIIWLKIYFVKVNINKRFCLIEKRQEFIDGRVRSRNQDWSLAEKLKSDEKPDQQSIARAISEELGIDSPVTAKFLKQHFETANSMSYPGLTTCSENYFYEVYLTNEQFKPEGYIEFQDDKTTYFVWQKI